MPGKKLAIHWKILIGLVAGLAVGVVLNLYGHLVYEAVGEDTVGRSVVDFVVRLNAFVGDLFLRGLRFIAVPIVLFSLIAGAGSLNDIKKLSRIGGKTVGIYLLTTAVAITVGLLFANAVEPGGNIPEDFRKSLLDQSGSVAQGKVDSAVPPDGWETLLNIVPTNPFASLAEGEMLQVVFLALLVGIALTLVKEDLARPVLRVCEGMTDAIIKIVHIIMYLAPYAVFALLAKVVSELGLEIFVPLAKYSGCVVAGLAIMMFLVYPAVLWATTRVSPRRFFAAIAPAQLLGFSSSSSSATLPVTMDSMKENMGVSDDVTSFALPLGATINMDGTALYQGVATMFITQLYGMDLSLTQQMSVVLTATLASIGTAGVPGVGIIMLIIVLQSLGLSPQQMSEGIALILGVDRILDMCRTSCNVTGDCAVATIVAHTEGELLSEEEVKRRKTEAASHGLDEHPLASRSADAGAMALGEERR